jgi:hypothetical protein
MNRDVVLALSALSIALLACGGSHKPANDESNDVTVLASKDMGAKAYDMPHYFALLSRKHGCQVNEKPDVAVSLCNEGNIGLVRTGTTVTVACKKTMSVGECKTLFDAIVAEGN